MRRWIHLWKPLGAIRPPSNLRQNAWTQVLVASGVRSDEASEQPRSSAALLLIVAARLCWTRRSAEAHCEFRWRSWTGLLQHRQRWSNRCHYFLLLVAHCGLCQQKFPHRTARSNNSAYCSPRFLHQAAYLRLRPSLKRQLRNMFSFLQRYVWRHFERRTEARLILWCRFHAVF